jgi:trigger factor
MQVTITDQTETDATLEITVPASEIAPHLEHVAEHLGQNLKVAGFRPGKAPAAVVRKQVGEQTFMTELLEHMIAPTYYDAVIQEKLTPVSTPQISVKAFDPAKELVYEAKVALLPPIKLGDPAKLKLKKEESSVSDEEVGQAVEELRRYRASEAAVARPAKRGDKVEIDFEGFDKGQPVLNTKSQKHPVVIGDGMLIPGFEENLEGMSRGEEKQFEITFPKEYHSAELAGKPLTFFVKLHEVYELAVPELSDEFAKSVGNFETVDKLREATRANLLLEKQQREDEKFRGELLNEFVEKSAVAVSEQLIDQEMQSLRHEVEHQVSHRGGTFEQYLHSLGKSEEEFAKELRPEAERRIKGGLVLAQYAKEQQIDADEREITTELTMQAMQSGLEQKQLEEQSQNPELRSRIRSQLITRKAMQHLSEAVSPAKADKKV